MDVPDLYPDQLHLLNWKGDTHSASLYRQDQHKKSSYEKPISINIAY